MPETRGRKPKNGIGEPKLVFDKVVAYMDACEDSDVYPDAAGMRLALGITKEQVAECQEEDFENHEAYRRIFNYAKDRRESWLTRKMTSEAKIAQGCLNALKQEENGGWTDKPAQNGDRKIILQIHNGSEELFK